MGVRCAEYQRYGCGMGQGASGCRHPAVEGGARPVRLERKGGRDPKHRLTDNRYGKLERNGTVRAIQANHDTSTIRPILDEEIRSALEALKASTLAIEKQNQALRSQQKALLAYREKVEDGKARRKRVSEQRRRKHALEKQHVEMAVS